MNAAQPQIARKIMLNTVSQVIAKILIGILSIVILKVLTTYMGKEGYGIYKSIFEFLALFAIIADMGLYTIGVREMSKNPDKEEMVMGNMLTARLIVIIFVSLIAFGSAFLIGEFQGTIATYAVAVASIGSVFAIMTGTVSTTLQVHLQMEKNSLGSIIGKIVGVLGMLIIIYLIYPHDCEPQAVEMFTEGGACSVSNSSFMWIIIAGVIGNIAMYVSTAHFSKQLTKIKLHFDWDFWRNVLWKALPYGIALILNQICFRIGSILLLNMKGASFVATYSAPSTMLEAAGIIPLYFMNAILPFLTTSLTKKDGSHKNIIQVSFDFLMMSALPIVIGTILLSYQFIYFITTPEFLTNLSTGYIGSDIVLQILIIALLFSFLSGLFGYVLVASDHQEKLLVRNLIGAVLTIVLTWWWIPKWGVKGAAYANVLTELYIFVASFLLAKRYINFSIKLKSFWKILFSSVIMGLVIYFLNGPTYNFAGLGYKNFIVLVPIGALVYGILLMLTGALTKDMIKMVLKKKIATSGDSITTAEIQDNIKTDD